MCDFFARSQAFVAKAVIACDHWCPSIHREAPRVVVRPANTCMETRLYYFNSLSDLLTYALRKGGPCSISLTDHIFVGYKHKTRVTSIVNDSFIDSVVDLIMSTVSYPCFSWLTTILNCNKYI